MEYQIETNSRELIFLLSCLSENSYCEKSFEDFHLNQYKIPSSKMKGVSSSNSENFNIRIPLKSQDLILISQRNSHLRFSNREKKKVERNKIKHQLEPLSLINFIGKC